MFALVKKYREVLALLSLLGGVAVTFFAHGKQGGDESPLLQPVRQLVLRLEAPLERVLNGAAFGGIDLWQGYVALRHVRAENLALRTRLLHASGEQVDEAEIVKENERLRELLHFADSVPLKTIAAQVIGDNLAPSALERVIRIGVGEAAGVRRGMPVLSEQGVVGRVTKVFRGAADVQLLVDRDSAIAVRVERSRARANVIGTGQDDLADLEYALRSDDIQENDVLVSSGTDTVFPPGLAVGKVVNVQRKISDTFLKAQVVPAVNVRSLQEVLVDMAPQDSLEAQQSSGELR